MHIKLSPKTHTTVSVETERYWLAGLLEGEGSFLKGPPSSPCSPIVQVAMTDEDVVVRAARLFARAVTCWDPPDPDLKRVYITRIKGSAARALMAGLLPVMGARRREQIEVALASPRPARDRSLVRGQTCTVSGCEAPVRARGLCRRHHNSWWKRKERGRPCDHSPTTLMPPAVAPVPLAIPSNSDDATAWLAGLLEGEGTFSNEQGYPRISADMCDDDVLTRAAELLGARIRPKDRTRTAEHGWNDVFTVAITGARGADQMRRLRPLMGVRRSRAIDLSLAAYHPIRLTSAPPTCVIEGCDRAHRARGLCNTHYMKWSRDAKAGKPQRIEPLR
ncbi:MAG: LAGLIDADG family homing endonuclease [Chloroflexota bacterium]|nr:LAGLIDADG family homing endonuclease [Chloroflexota bacterium]